jgi:hypothetical protein
MEKQRNKNMRTKYAAITTIFAGSAVIGAPAHNSLPQYAPSMNNSMRLHASEL